MAAFPSPSDLRGKSKLRALACSRFAIGALVVTGKVLIARTEATPREEPWRVDPGRCTERIERIERTCERDVP
jgi:hypothetical protein